MTKHCNVNVRISKRDTPNLPYRRWCPKCLVWSDITDRQATRDQSITQEKIIKPGSNFGVSR